jgi:hypothetical protein
MLHGLNSYYRIGQRSIPLDLTMVLEMTSLMVLGFESVGPMDIFEMTET